VETYKVKAGETISSIAKLNSVDATDLANENNIRNINLIKENKILRIPKKKIKNTPLATAPKAPLQERKFDVSHLEHRDEDALIKVKKFNEIWLTELLQHLRINEANEHVQHVENVLVTEQKKSIDHKKKSATKPGSKSPRQLNHIKEKLKEALGKEPHILTFKGVTLSENEKKQIIASVAVCEMNADGFGSINSDQEFIGRKYGSRGSEESYSRIVHIGISYGIIQYSQDSGSLGMILTKMRDKNKKKFDDIFGGGDSEISSELIELTNSGRKDLQNDASIPLCGLAYWQKIHSTKKGKDILDLANSEKLSELPALREIRGKRVQPISAEKSKPATDLWTGIWKDRFLAAGKVVEFQEVQLEVAVNNYFNPQLKSAKENGVRSALSLAFIAACAIRGGTHSKLSKLFYDVAAELKIDVPFKNSEDELKCVTAISEAKGKLGTLKIAFAESQRAKLLLNDELGFLTEDLYDCSTYD